MKILILNPNADQIFTPALMEKLKKVGDVELVKKPQPFEKVKGIFSCEEKILAIDPDFCDWYVPDKVIEKAKNVKAICLQSTSYDWINVLKAKKRGFPVVNIRDWCTQSTAEWALLLAEMVARKLPSMKKISSKDRLLEHHGIEMKGKVVGVIGLGKVGSTIAKLCKAKGMKVQYWSRNSRDKRFKYIALKELIKTSDLIFPAVAINKDTKKLISRKMLKSMKKSAILVAIWPMKKLFDHDFVLSMVKDGNIYGYAFEQDGLKKQDFSGNVMATEAVGWATEDSMKRNAEKWVENIVKASKGNFENRVN